MKKLAERLLDKSIESFFMAIEVYNKPTIRYRVEGFSLFICNAWELMLKAHMIDQIGETSIYYDDRPGRTLSLETCIRKVFTNKKAPLRLNLEKIIELRNTSTHFITEEYEMVYVPLFQACVFNYTEKMQDFFNKDMAKLVAQNFLTLSVSMHPLDVNDVRAKYPAELAEKLIETSSAISELSIEQSPSFSIRIEHYHLITKDKGKATSVVHIDKNATPGATILRQMQDPRETHKYKAKRCIEQINRKLTSKGIDAIMNSHHFNNFVKYYGLKENPKFCFCYNVTQNPLYSYSMSAIDLIVEEIVKDPSNILKNIKKKLSEKK